MRVKVLIGGGKVAKMMKKNITKRLEKRQKKGQIEYTHSAQGTSDYYDITGDEQYLHKVYSGVSRILSMCVDDNLISRAASKVNKTLGEKHRETIKGTMTTIFDIHIWMEDDDGTIIKQHG